MKKESQRGRSQDRNKVAGGQDYEVNYEKQNQWAIAERKSKRS